MVIPLEDKTIEYYEGAVQRAREEKVVNKWTKRTLEHLNKYVPTKYPLYKKEQHKMAQRTRTGHSYVSAETYQQSLVAPVPASPDSPDAATNSQKEQP